MIFNLILFFSIFVAFSILVFNYFPFFQRFKKNVNSSIEMYNLINEGNDKLEDLTPEDRHDFISKIMLFIRFYKILNLVTYKSKNFNDIDHNISKTISDIENHIPYNYRIIQLPDGLANIKDEDFFLFLSSRNNKLDVVGKVIMEDEEGTEILEKIIFQEILELNENIFPLSKISTESNPETK